LRPLGHSGGERDGPVSGHSFRSVLGPLLLETSLAALEG